MPGKNRFSVVQATLKFTLFSQIVKNYEIDPKLFGYHFYSYSKRVYKSVYNDKKTSVFQLSK